MWLGILALPLVVPEKDAETIGVLLPGGSVDTIGRMAGPARINVVAHRDAGSSLMWAYAADQADPARLGSIEVLPRNPGAMLLPLVWGEQRLHVGVRLQGYESWPATFLTVALRTMDRTDFQLTQPLGSTVGAHRREQWVEVPLGNPDAVALEVTLTAREKEGDRTALHAVLPAGFLRPLDCELTYYRFDQQLEIGLRPARDEVLAAGDHGAVTITPFATGTPVLSLDLPRTAEGTFAATADISDLPPGRYELAGEVVAAGGAPLATVHREWDCEPGGWDWVRSLGEVDGVLPPWTPVEAHGSVASCWGRDYDLSGGLPASLTSAGQELLAAPVSLTAQLGGEQVSLVAGDASVQSRGPVASEVRSASKQAGVSADLTGRLEYDGLIRYQVTLTPEGALQLADLALTIPLRSGLTTLLNYTPLDRDQPLVYEGEGSFAHALPEGDGVAWSAGFAPFVWVGDEDVGLSWMMEDDRAFELAEGEPAVQIVRSGERTDLRINFGRGPRTLTTPVTIDFALQPTPVRPLPDDWRSWRWISQTWQTLAGPEARPGQRWHNISIYWWTLYGDVIGSPVAREWTAMGDYAEYLRAKDDLLLPYMQSGSVPTRAPEGGRYQDQWCSSPKSSADAMVRCCPRSDFASYVVWYADYLMRHYRSPGVYIDLAGLRPCTNEAHGCGYHRGDELRPTVPIFAARHMYQRLRGLSIQHGIEPLIVTSSRWKWPQYFYADSSCSGEQFYHPINTDKKPYHEIAPLEHWRAEFLSPQYGTVSVFLPAWRDAAVYARPDETRQMLALTLQHEVEVWPIWCNGGEVAATWKAKERFGMTPEVSFHPYWREQKLVTCGAPELLIGVYTGEGRAMAVVSNMAGEQRDVLL
ncbi:MAG TPA: glycoside hydrolase domain-containing protein, partial [Armatimonadota bacterium]|nr:glycoside hydrolase domain-containing protein [Armatimonadota bacterium]